MKTLIILIINIILCFTITCTSRSLFTEKRLSLKAILTGDYTFSVRNSESDNESHYFLIEINLENDTDTICKFVTKSCATGINFLTDNRNLVICGKACGGNFTKCIEVEPGEVFSISLIIKTVSYEEIVGVPVRIGLVLLRTDNFTDFEELLYQKKMKNEDIIWSNPFFLDTWGQSYKIYKKARE